MNKLVNVYDWYMFTCESEWIDNSFLTWKVIKGRSEKEIERKH